MRAMVLRVRNDVSVEMYAGPYRGAVIELRVD